MGDSNRSENDPRHAIIYRMTDRFIDRVANLAGDTTRVLKQTADALEQSGLVTQANILRRVAALHEQIALDCLIETQPIEVARFQLPERIAKQAEALKDLAADLLERGHPGHSEVAEAAELLENALKNRVKI